MKRSHTATLWLFFALYSLNHSSSIAQILIADYPLTSNSLDQTGHFGPITYGTNGTPPPTAACANGSNYGTFQTPVLSSLFNKSNFQIDLDFKSNGSAVSMPVWMIGPSYRTIGVYISSAGKIGIKYNNSNTLFSNSTILTGTYFHVSLKYVEPNFWLFWNNSPVPLLTQALPPLIFDSDPSDIKLLPEDLSNAAIFNGCIKNLKIYSACTVEFTPTHTDATCNQPNGTITVNATGGSGQYKYSKDNGVTFQDNNVFSGLAAQTYKVVVQDKGGAQCKSDVEDVPIGQKGGSVQFTPTPSNASCNQANGTITVTATGGSGQYKYSKDNGVTYQDNNVFTGLAAQTYKVVVQDKVGAQCKSDVKDVPISQTGSVQFTPTPSDATCNQANGTITIAATGGSGQYKYSKDNGVNFQDNNVFSGLAAQTYKVMVQDKGGAQCKSDVKDVTINQKGGSVQFTATPSNATCNQANGTITVNATGGSGQYKYSKDNGINFQDNSIFSGLVAQTYEVVVQDKGGSQCKSEVQNVSVLLGSSKPSVTATATPTNCDQSNGSLTITANSGSGSYQYSIDNGVTFKDENVFSGLMARTYQVMVKDKGEKQCKSDVKIVVIGAEGVGAIYNDVTVTPGKPYKLEARPNIGDKYAWSPPADLDAPTTRTPTVTTNSDRLYKITITSATGCTTVDQQKVLVAKVGTGSKDSVVAVPTAFTPNNNGANDRLKPIAYGIDKLTYFKVYNRWGQLVFETQTVGEGWDGNLKGKPQPTETYMWILECVTLRGETIKKNGRSVLIR